MTVTTTTPAMDRLRRIGLDMVSGMLPAGLAHELEAARDGVNLAALRYEQEGVEERLIEANEWLEDVAERVCVYLDRERHG